jgi:hypothetical protein
MAVTDLLCSFISGALDDGSTDGTTVRANRTDFSINLSRSRWDHEPCQSQNKQHPRAPCPHNVFLVEVLLYYRGHCSAKGCCKRKPPHSKAPIQLNSQISSASLMIVLPLDAEFDFPMPYSFTRHKKGKATLTAGDGVNNNIAQVTYLRPSPFVDPSPREHRPPRPEETQTKRTSK